MPISTRSRSKSPARGRQTKVVAASPARKSPARAAEKGGSKATPKTADEPKSAAAAKKHEPEFEFGGPVGAAALLFVLPFVIYILYFLAPGKLAYAKLFNPAETEEDDYTVTVSEIGGLVPQLTKTWDALKPEHLISLDAIKVVVAWMLFQVAIDRLLPGPVYEGVKLRDGSRLLYKCNGHLAFWVSLFAVDLIERGMMQKYDLGDYKLSWIYDNYMQLATASMIVSVSIAMYVYAISFVEGEMLSLGGNSGTMVYDFFIGRSLNPRFKFWKTFDIKEFCELKPGLIGWCVINLGCMAKQYELKGEISPEMIAVNMFQGVYVWDALINERAILTTMDITTDGFGYMLAFGDLSWVPFTYTLQARYLVEHNPDLGHWKVLAICALNAIGFTIFRGANSEKDAFRRDPSAPEVAHLEYLNTKRGTRLLVTGWWGMARKINYTGDWLMGLSWCAITGFNTTLTFFYAIYFAILLIHRSLRDDHDCRGKYGDDWDRYKARVPYVFIPYVY